MRTPVMTSLGLVCFSCIALISTAHAQRGATTEETLAELGQSIDELRAQTVQIPTLASTVQELGARVAELERAFDELRRAQATIPDAITRLDRLRDRIDSLTRDVNGVRTQLADMAHSGDRPPGGEGIADGNRFALMTDDGRFKLALWGFMQARFQLDIDDIGGDDSEVRESTFRMRRARIGFSGHLGTPRMVYEFALSGIAETPLFDYYMDYAFRPYARVRVGQYKTLFTRSFITSSHRRAFTEMSLAVDTLRYARDVQLGVHGDIAGQRFAYYLGLGNGAGANRTNDNLDANVIVRADAVVLGERFGYGYGDVARTENPALMIGGGLVYDLTPMPSRVADIDIRNDVDADGTIDNVRVISASLDASFRMRGVEAVIEAIMRSESYGTILDHGDNAALVTLLGGTGEHSYVNVVGQISYVLPVAIRSHRILIGARLGRAKVPVLGLGGRADQVPVGRRVLELDGLVQLYDPRGRRLFGIDYSMHDYSAIDSVDGTGGRVHRLVMETQLAF